MALRTDEMGFGGLRLLQDPDAFCYGVDAVLLADFSKARKEDDVLDMCCGNGAVSLIIEALYSPRKITGLELQTVLKAGAASYAATQRTQMHCFRQKASALWCATLRTLKRGGASVPKRIQSGSQGTRARPALRTS